MSNFNQSFEYKIVKTLIRQVSNVVKLGYKMINLDRLNESIIRFECSPKPVTGLGARGFYRSCRKAVNVFAAAVAVMTLASCGGEKVSVRVSNQTGSGLGPRCMELSGVEILKRLGTPGFYVTDENGKEVVSQLTADSLILFMADVPEGETRHFTVHPCDTLRSYTSTVAGQFYPKRRDDVSYENELVGFRIYGPGTQQAGEKSFGYDLFLKHPTDELIVPQLYAPETDDAVWAKVDSLRRIDNELAEEFIKTFSYHLDHGLGMDCYAVGATLGAGVAAILEGDSIRYPWCYEKAEILDNGPLRFTLALDFAPVSKGGSAKVTEHRIITLDSQSHLNRCRIWYDGLEGETIVVAGFPLRDDSEVIEDKESGIITYADPTQGPDNGKAMVGVVMECGVDSIFRKEGHALMATRMSPTDTLDYRWGFAWDRTDIGSLAEWKKYLDRSGLNYTVEY